MTKIEKIMIVAIVILLIIFIVFSTKAMRSVKDNGGARQMIIDAGREVKSIGEEIIKE